MPNNNTPHYYLGLPQWHHDQWYGKGINSKKALPLYASHFSSVEGNTSFYGLPSQASISAWNEASREPFRFCFKFPKTISHQAALKHCSPLVSEFLQRITPLQPKLGTIWLQMSQKFTPSQLPYLKTFIEQLPKDFDYGVEVRHLGFFNKGDEERYFNQLLMQHGINRVIFDTRSLFAHANNDPDTQDALRKKPRVPTHVLATGKAPFVRFISPMDTTLCQQHLTQWVNKTLSWIDEGKTPYIFIHTPSNQQSPELARQFSQQIATLRPAIKAINLWPKDPIQHSLL